MISFVKKAFPSIGYFSLAAMLFWTAGLQAQPHTASVSATFTSLQFSSAYAAMPEYGTVLTEWTTSDGTNSANVFPYYQVVGNSYKVSGEFAPRPNGTYVADYLMTASRTVVEFGSVTLTVPFVDADGDGVPDLLQPALGVTINISASTSADAPYALTRGWSGQITRAAGATQGSYYLQRFDADTILTGTWQLGVSNGTVTYDRTANILSLKFTATGANNTIVTTTGTAALTVNGPDQFSLAQLLLTRNTDGAGIVQQPSVFTRVGKTYVSNTTLSDGSLDTFWPDYTGVHMVITDLNDLDANGIPDLTDFWGQTATITSQPDNERVNQGGSARFTVVAAGTQPFSFQWSFNNTALTNQTTASLLLSNVQLTNAGAYSVTVSNKYGGTVSRGASLTVNQAPSVSISSPTNGASFLTSDLVTLSATAADADGQVKTVNFYDGATFLETVSGPPFSITRAFSTGVHAIVAIAVDDLNLTTTSPPVAFGVQAPNQLPSVVLLSPLNGSVYLTNRLISAEALALDPDGHIGSLQLVLDSAVTIPLVGSQRTDLANLLPGNHRLVAIATDDRGGSSTSAPVSFAVTIAPTLSTPRFTNGIVYIAAQGTSSLRYALELSFDQKAWFSQSTNLAARGTGKLLFTDPRRPGISQQYYRVVVAGN